MPGLLRGVARTAAIAGTATAVSNRVSRRQAGRWAQQEQAQAYEQQQAYQQPAYQQPTYQQPTYQQPAYQQPASQQPVPQQSGGTDQKLEQLRQLGELRQQGVLSDAEFEQQKAQILSS